MGGWLGTGARDAAATAAACAALVFFAYAVKAADGSYRDARLWRGANVAVREHSDPAGLIARVFRVSYVADVDAVDAAAAGVDGGWVFGGAGAEALWGAVTGGLAGGAAHARALVDGRAAVLQVPHKSCPLRGTPGGRVFLYKTPEDGVELPFPAPSVQAGAYAPDPTGYVYVVLFNASPTGGLAP